MKKVVIDGFELNQDYIKELLKELKGEGVKSEKDFVQSKTVPRQLYNDINNEVFLGDGMCGLSVSVARITRCSFFTFVM